MGPVSLLGLLSMGYGALAWTLWVIRPHFGSRNSMAVGFFMALFALWAGVSMFRLDSRIDLPNLQNLAVLMGFFGLFLLSSRLSATYPDYGLKVKRWILWAGIVASGLYGLSVALGGLESSLIVGTRTYALFALIPIAIAFANARHGSRADLYWGLFMTLMVAASLSRLALVIALILLGLSLLPAKGSLWQWGKFVGLFAAALTILVAAVFNIEPLRKRFFTGDVSVQVAGVGINMMGRGDFWVATWQSFLESPWTGKGAGSASNTIIARFGERITHPHNDYLRLLHDYGLIGCLFFAAAFMLMLWSALTAWLRAYSRGSPSATLHFAAFLALAGIALSSTTDNSVSYIFVMAPLAILVGASVGHNPRGSA
ncbi:MAG: O-antigen ligase family protein [Meiothermus sp.]|nr:O-antigen ligase family protein [Meiothermus sp.]